MPSPGETPLKTPSSAVITVSYGSGAVLEEFLQSLRDFHGWEQTVVVVDNKPDHDGVAEIAARFGADYVALPNNPGYGAGMNAGVRSLDTEFDTYFFCNPDVRFLGPTIGPLANSLLQDQAAGSVGPQLLNDDGSVYPSARNIPSIGTGVGHALFSKIWPANPWTRAYQNSSNYAERRGAGSLSGAAVMLTRQAYETIDGWDEAYFIHFEDIDLGYRLGLAGFRNIYDPSIAVHHSGAHSTKNYAALVEQAMTTSAIRFMRKRYSGFWRTPLRWSITVALQVRGTLKQLSIRRKRARTESSR